MRNGTEFLAAALNYEEADALAGRVPVVHQDAVSDSSISPQSAIIMRASDEVIHGMIHVLGADFTHQDALKDAEHLKEMLSEGANAAMGFQFHPELEQLAKIIEFSIQLKRTGRPDYSAFTSRTDNVSEHVLRLMRNFMLAHERFQGEAGQEAA